ncbi:type II toxin-antitoxin system antitoxin SocA domain-containing protein [Halarcobacter sp.]|uniref:type II toxin-antitoxin system antitoxin SocA domain-containing protein n=1 Tax=Halarcobacter sp. TaxID=2321133 RepID=UPI0029F5907C|nr:type II toxin-antitoxin system antitoxin SocA domain-containing protein [Halarcobacter sp.]
MKIDITKIANVILYMLENDMKHLNDKKLSILLFLIEFEHQKNFNKKIFNEQFIKQKRNPEPMILSEIFDIIANNEDVDEDDERLYLITELLDYLDIEILTKEKFIELNFIKMEEDFDKSLFSKDEMETISNITNKYQEDTARKVANACFQIEEVRQAPLDEIII